MILYYQSYLMVLKRNFMLFIMAFVLLTVTFFLWAGVPFFIIGSILVNVTSNMIIIHLAVSLSGGLLFSLYFILINLKVAKHVANIKKSNLVKTFIWIEFIWIIMGALIFEIVLSVGILF